MVSVILLLICLLLSSFLSTGLLFSFCVSAIFFQTEFRLHNKPENEEKNGKCQLHSTNDSHDELVLIIVVGKVRSLLSSIVVHNDQIEHQGANEIWNISGSLPDSIDKIRGNWKSHFLASKRSELPVVELVILLDFLLDIFIVTE